MPPEYTWSSTNLWMCPRWLHLATHPGPMNPSSPFPVETDSLKTHAPASNPQIDEIPQKPTEMSCHFQHGEKIVNGLMLSLLNTNLTTHLKEQNKFHPPQNLVIAPPYNATYPLLSIQLASTWMTSCAGPTDARPGRTTSPHTSSSQTPHFRKKAHSEEMVRNGKVKWLQSQRTFDEWNGLYPQPLHKQWYQHLNLVNHANQIQKIPSKSSLTFPLTLQNHLKILWMQK